MNSRRHFLLGFALFAIAPISLIRAAETGTATHTIYLVRHGMYDFVDKADDKTANALNALGRDQAALVADRLAALPVKFNSIVSSQFTRARETGDIIAAKLGATCGRDAFLNECTPPGVGVAATSIDAGAEAQLQQAWTRFAVPTPATATHDVLVCHGNVIRWFVCKALGVDLQQWSRMEIANASLTVITIRSDGTTRLNVFSEIGHVPIAKQTWSGRGPGWSVPATK
jgi:serine/threonine-protein phosphatase PGAM5